MTHKCHICEGPAPGYSDKIDPKDVLCEECFIDTIEMTIKNMIRAEEMIAKKLKPN